MKKVLIIGPEFHDYNLSIERAFKKLGFETKVLGYFGNQVTSTSERIAYHLSKDKKVFLSRIRDRFNENVLNVHSTFQPDLVFMIQGSDIYEGTVEKMHGSKRVLWMMDSIFTNEGAYGMRHTVDHIFLFEKTDVPLLWEKDKIKGRFLPLSVDEDVYFPTSKSEKIDILFVGNLFARRIELLEKVAEKFSNYRISIYGLYYAPLRRPFYHLFRKNKNVFLNKIIPPAEVNKLYNQSRVCLNIHHQQSRHGVNQRFFEISGSRAFQLVDTNPYISDNFTSDEIVTYSTTVEMLEKIDAALRGGFDITRYATNAYQEVLAKHTFTHRIREVLETINAGEAV